MLHLLFYLEYNFVGQPALHTTSANTDLCAVAETGDVDYALKRHSILSWLNNLCPSGICHLAYWNNKC